MKGNMDKKTPAETLSVPASEWIESAASLLFLNSNILSVPDCERELSTGRHKTGGPPIQKIWGAINDSGLTSSLQFSAEAQPLPTVKEPPLLSFTTRQQPSPLKPAHITALHSSSGWSSGSFLVCNTLHMSTTQVVLTPWWLQKNK